jgi:hypothetical protein
VVLASRSKYTDQKNWEDKRKGLQQCKLSLCIQARPSIELMDTPGVSANEIHAFSSQLPENGADETSPIN